MIGFIRRLSANAILIGSFVVDQSILMGSFLSANNDWVHAIVVYPPILMGSFLSANNDWVHSSSIRQY